MDKESLIYKNVKKEADKKFKSKTGIYKSAWIVKEYKKRNGIFKTKKPSKQDTGLLRWFEEQWVRISPNGNPSNNSCGRTHQEITNNVKKGFCRPLKRITKHTPKTVTELGTKILKQRYNQKTKNPDKKISK